MTAVKLSPAQKRVLSLVRQGSIVTGRSVTTLRRLEQLGLVTDILCTPEYNPVRGYAVGTYTARLTDAASGYF